jgi:hypothetical protein
MTQPRCRHRDSWLIAGGNYEWCYRCGALRRMQETGIAQVTPQSVWCRPVGPRGENPWPRFKARTDRYLKAHDARQRAA